VSLKAVIEQSDPMLHAPAFGHQLTKLEGDGFDLAIALAPRTARYRPRATTVRDLRERWSESIRYESTNAPRWLDPVGAHDDPAGVARWRCAARGLREAGL